MVKRKRTKPKTRTKRVKQSQSQKQSVVVNIGNHTRQRRRRNRAPLRSAHGSVIKHVHSYTGNVFQANLERENAEVVREQNILRQERAEIQKLKQIKAKEEEYGTGLSPTPSLFNEVVSDLPLLGTTPAGPRPSGMGRSKAKPPQQPQQSAKTEVASYMRSSGSSRAREAETSKKRLDLSGE
jgi:hypothetical protein